MEMFKGDMKTADLYGSLINIPMKNNPLRQALKETFLSLDVEGLFNRDSFFNEATVNLFEFKELSTYIETSSSIKNNIDHLINVFPQLDELVGEMDLAARYGEEELEDCESTPDTKLHYPEPFIASPSFVHEEI
jgi:hypothetical protein